MPPYLKGLRQLIFPFFVCEIKLEISLKRYMSTIRQPISKRICFMTRTSLDKRSHGLIGIITSFSSLRDES